MVKITPNEMYGICNAAFKEMINHRKDYEKSFTKLQEVIKWLTTINWDDANESSIMIDELPF